MHRAAGDDLALAQDDGRVADPLDALTAVVLAAPALADPQAVEVRP